MTERKRRAQTILVGCQGHPVHDNMHSVVPLLHMSTIHALQHHAPTLAETMRIAGRRETVMLSEYCISDAIASEELAKASFVRSRMTLEVWGLLR